MLRLCIYLKREKVKETKKTEAKIVRALDAKRATKEKEIVKKLSELIEQKEAAQAAAAAAAAAAKEKAIRAAAEKAKR